MNRISQITINKSETYLVIISSLLLVLIISSCATQKHMRKDAPYLYDDDNKNINEPASRKPSLMLTSVDRTFFDQMEEMFDIERSFRKLFGHPQQALNINSYDEVPNSSWFTNRHGMHRMSLEEIQNGRVLSGGPDTSGTWTVFRPKGEGATPGFWIEDKNGHQFIIKFDPPDHSEMATAAAAMASRYFHACGYNVPEETIVYFKPEILKIKEGAKIKDKYGKKHPFVQKDLDDILSKVERNANGYYRSLSSRALTNVKGPFSYNGLRRDDPNDWCAHEHRRELRGLYVIASFINHHDTKDLNTLDAFEEEDGNRFLKHYLIDFGSTFGSDGDAPKPVKKGYANVFDLRDVFVSLVTLGLKSWPWEYAKPYQYPSIGYFESEIFQPQKFDPIIPNPAFENMTRRDAYWGAKIVMSFRDDDLKALVKAGQYSNPDAEAYLLKTLIERRDKIGKYWFSKVNPLDYFTVNYEDNGLKIDFDDLSVKYMLVKKEETHYNYIVKHNGKEILSNKGLNDSELNLSKANLELMASKFSPPKSKDIIDNYLFEIQITTQRVTGLQNNPTVLWLWYLPETEKFNLVGIEHLD